MTDLVNQTVVAGLGSPDLIVADRLASLVKVDDPLIVQLAALCVAAGRDAHACVDLSRLSPEDFEVSLTGLGLRADVVSDLTGELVRRLSDSPAVRVIDPSEKLDVLTSVKDARPLVLLNRFLYSQRQFVDELSVAEQFVSRQRGSITAKRASSTTLADQVKPRSDDADANIENDVLRAIGSTRFMILTGGPGTGKTTMTITAIAVMMMLSDTALEESDIALCAPTGKAAARLKEAVGEFLADERRSSWISPPVRTVLGRITPTTIHRLLGRSQGEVTRFFYNSKSRLPHSIVAVDEASMISSQLMARLLEAVPRESRLLIVGDPGQLESVEAGSVLGQLVSGSLSRQAGGSGRVEVGFTLKKVWRTGKGSAIPPLANAIREGIDSAVVQQLMNRQAGVEWIDIEDPSVSPQEVAGEVVDVLRRVMELAHVEGDESSHAQALELAGSAKVLCGPHDGGRGVRFWNEWIAEQLGLSVNDRITPGRLVLVEQNSPRVGLSNGDIGLVVATPEGPQVAFPGVGTSSLRYLQLSSLPPVATCFAMTVHKSQGSEYKDLVVVILPAAKSPLLNRQLLYTAITRTKNRVRVVGPELAVRRAVLNESGRASGLAELLDQIGELDHA
jgi:exodeoxyribonuclease V alpha subunit